MDGPNLEVILKANPNAPTNDQFTKDFASQLFIPVDQRKVEIPLNAFLIDQSVSVDRCAQLLEQMDSAFAMDGIELLFWHVESSTLEAIDRMASELETTGLLRHGEKFNVTLETRGQEFSRNKRVQPTASYPLTLVDGDVRQSRRRWAVQL